MSDKYKIHEPDKAYFITMTTVGWVDILTRNYAELTSVLDMVLELPELKIHG